MLGIGISLVLSYFYGRFQYDAIVDHESFTISLIGATLSLSWYSPFFIGSYWLYRKSIKIGKNNIILSKVLPKSIVNVI